MTQIMQFPYSAKSADVTAIPTFRAGEQRALPPAPADERDLVNMTDAELAAMEFAPWPRDPRPGPSAKQWKKWNLEHGAALRVACALMQQDKKSLTEHCAHMKDSEWEQLSAMFEHSINFFSSMAAIIKGVRARLLVATAAAHQPEGPVS